MTKPDAELTADELALLDRTAELTAAPDGRFGELRALYADRAYGRAVRARLGKLGLR